MIFIKDLTKITDIKYLIGYQSNFPFDAKNGYKINDVLATKEQMEQIGKLVEMPTEPVDVEGKSKVMYYNPISNTCFWEYVDAPIQPKTEIEELKKQQELMQKAIDDLVLGGM